MTPKPSTTWLTMNAANAQHGMKMVPSQSASYKAESKVN